MQDTMPPLLQTVALSHRSAPSIHAFVARPLSPVW